MQIILETWIFQTHVWLAYSERRPLQILIHNSQNYVIT